MEMLAFIFRFGVLYLFGPLIGVIWFMGIQPNDNLNDIDAYWVMYFAGLVAFGMSGLKDRWKYSKPDIVASLVLYGLSVVICLTAPVFSADLSLLRIAGIVEQVGNAKLAFFATTPIVAVMTYLRWNPENPLDAQD